MMARWFQGSCLAFLTIVVAGCATTTAPFPSLESAYEPAGADDISLTDYALTFEDEFDRLDASGRRCDTRWIAHTPWGGDFGAAAFMDPSRGFPFVTQEGMLRIEARKEEGRWLAGLLSSHNTCGEGFAQKFGYFELRAKLPPEADGFWPAFWLIGVDRSRYTAELDVFEQHSMRPERLVSSVRVHARAEGVEPHHVYSMYHAPEGSLSDGFNTYGVSIEEEEIVVYFNRREIWRTATPEEFKQPMYILFNLAMEPGEISENTPEQAFMYVDYVKVYARQ